MFGKSVCTVEAEVTRPKCSGNGVQFGPGNQPANERSRFNGIMYARKKRFTSPKPIVFALLSAALAFSAGCKKSEKKEQGQAGGPKAVQKSATSPDTILRVHWLGKKRLAAETNAAAFMEIWNLPESAKLEAQTLDKLAVAPWHPWTTNQAPITNYPSLISNHPPASLLRHSTAPTASAS